MAIGLSCSRFFLPPTAQITRRDEFNIYEARAQVQVGKQMIKLVSEMLAESLRKTVGKETAKERTPFFSSH